MNDQKLRKVIRTMIRDQNLQKKRLHEGDAEELYNVFVAPFTDVLKSASLATQDTLNSLNLVFRQLITLSPKKMAQNQKEFEARKAKINEKWKPLMDGADVALNAGDAGLLAMVVAPQLFLGAKLGKAGLEAPKNVATYLNQSGWTVPLSGLLGAGGKDTGVTPMEKGLMGKGIDIAKQVMGLFYIESYLKDMPLLLEAEDSDESEEAGIKDFQKELEKHFEDIGLNEVFESTFEEIFEAKKEFIDKTMEMADQQLEFLTSFANAQTFEEFQLALSNGASSGIDVGEVSEEVEKVAAELANKAEELAADKDFKKEIADTKLGEDMSDEEMKTAADEAAAKLANDTVAEIKEKFKNQLEEGIPELKELVMEAILEGTPEEGSKDFSIIAKSANGKKYLTMLKEAKEKVAAYKVNSAAQDQITQ
jgi:hypothetical protein